jgi:hypothetical protein
MADNCGKCGSSNTFSGSWSPSKCLDCGAIEGPSEWYYEECELSFSWPDGAQCDGFEKLHSCPAGYCQKYTLLTCPELNKKCIENVQRKEKRKKPPLKFIFRRRIKVLLSSIQDNGWTWQHVSLFGFIHAVFNGDDIRFN